MAILKKILGGQTVLTVEPLLAGCSGGTYHRIDALGREQQLKNAPSLLYLANVYFSSKLPKYDHVGIALGDSVSHTGIQDRDIVLWRDVGDDFDLEEGYVVTIEPSEEMISKEWSCLRQVYKINANGSFGTKYLECEEERTEVIERNRIRGHAVYHFQSDPSELSA